MKSGLASRLPKTVGLQADQAMRFLSKLKSRRSYLASLRAWQLCLVLAFSLIVLPVSGPGDTHGPVLSSLRTTFVPFDASVESPSPTPLQFSVAPVSNGRLALAWTLASYLSIPEHDLFGSFNVDNFGHSTFIAFVSGRSPPLAS